MENELKPCAYNEKLVRLKDVNDALTAQFMDSPLDSDRWVIGRIQFRVNEIPAVDAAEVRHARWIPHPDKEVRDYDCCTWCGIGTKRREYGINPDGREYVTEYSFRYCPWCGARMDGEDVDA